MISSDLFSCADRKQAITRTSIDQVLWRHMPTTCFNWLINPKLRAVLQVVHKTDTQLITKPVVSQSLICVPFY